MAKKKTAKPKAKKKDTKKKPTLEEKRILVAQQVRADLLARKTAGLEGINLDEQDSDWLMAFWSMTRNEQRFVKETLFPDRLQNSNDLRDAMDDLCAYAVARACVLDGKESLVYEQHCKIYYSNLPMWARFKTNAHGTVI